MGDPILSVQELTKCYTGTQGTVRAVDGISVEVERGEVVGLLGANGAGKTTTIKCILGLVRPTRGCVHVDGWNPETEPDMVYSRIGAVLEGARNVYWRLTVRENLRFFVACQGVHPNRAQTDIDRVLSLVGLKGKEHEQVRDLSRGMQQRASLAAALVRDPELLVLDEPTLGLDVESTFDLRREIRRLAEVERRTIVLSSHDMTLVQALCDRVIILNDGHIAADDAIENLAGIFGNQTFKIVFEQGSVKLDELSIGFDITIDGRNPPSVTATFSNHDEFYRFIDVCRAENMKIEVIESVTPDLERIFLDTISNSESPTAVVEDPE